MLPPEEKLRLLSMVDILEPLSREEIKELSIRVPDTHYQRGQILYTPQEKSEALFMLKKGRVRIYRVGPDGREFTLTVVGSGTVFGEMPRLGQRLHIRRQCLLHKRGGVPKRRHRKATCARNRGPDHQP